SSASTAPLGPAGTACGALAAGSSVIAPPSIIANRLTLLFVSSISTLSAQRQIGLRFPPPSVFRGENASEKWSLLTRDRTGLVRRRESLRQGDGHLSGGSPLRASLKSSDKAEAAHAVEIVAHRRVEDAALAVAHRPDHRLVFAGAALVFRGIRRGDQMHVFGRPTHTVIQLVRGVHPLARHILHDRVLSITNR